ncbi:hypothetical protein MFIFM68171_03762 [Madurella fahalii]|uniref:Ubiquitin-like domain-containing protein n=1 Tax=Madurella fahalii TaxID=1157608 RepID=A0ABQ0G715_9PEZI
MAENYEGPTVESGDESSIDISQDMSEQAGQQANRFAPEDHDNEPSPRPQSRTGGQVHQDPTDAARSTAFSRSGFNPRTSDEGNIFVKDGIGRKLSFPFKLAMTWHGFEDLIQQACLHISSIGREVKEGRYDLIAPDGSVILPSVWNLSVQPGWFVTMRMWKDEDDEKEKEQAELKKAMLEEAKAEVEMAAKGKMEAPVKFKDAVGRKFSFPFHLVRTWAGMEELIKQAFLHVDVLGPHVMEGHYDLIGPNGEVILPSVWENVIEPDWSITMHMWPMEQKGPMPGQQHAVGPRGQFPRPPGFPTLTPRQPGQRPPGAGPPPPPPPPPGWWPSGPPYPSAPQVVVTRPAESKKKKKPSGTNILGWMAGGRGRRARTSVGDTSPIHSQSRSPSSSAEAATYDPLPPSPKLKRAASGHSAEGVLASVSGQQKSVPAARAPVDLSWEVSKKLQPVYNRSRHNERREGSPRAPSTVSHSRSRSSKANPVKGEESQSHGAREDESEVEAADESGSLVSKDAGENARMEVVRKGLVVVYRAKNRRSAQRPFQVPLRRQTIKPLGKAVSDPWTLEIKSARVYWEELTMGGAASLELIRRTKHPAADKIKAQGEGEKQTMWLHVTRAFMSFQEFEDMAQFDLLLDEKTRRLVSCVMDSIKSDRLDEDWYIKPGTVLRCDGNLEEDEHESVIFASIPNLHSNPYDIATARRASEGICPERRLHDAFGSLSIHYEQNKGRFALEGRHRHDLWVRQTWILVTGSCVFTYGSFLLDVLQGQTIAILDEALLDTDGSGGIQIVDDDRRLFYIPSANLKSYYELKVAVSDRLIKAGNDKVKNCAVHLQLPDGKELDPKTWAKVLGSDELPTLKVSLEELTPSPPSSADSSSSTRSSRGSSTHSRNMSNNSLDLDDDRGAAKVGHEKESDSASRLLAELNDQTPGQERHANEEGDFILLSVDSEEVPNARPIDIPELNGKVPPFFGWMTGDNPRGVKSVEKGFKEGVIRADLKLSRPDAITPHSNSLLVDLYKSFGEADVYQDAPMLTFIEFEQARTRWAKGKGSWKNPLVSHLYHEKMMAMAGAYFDAAILTLESFVSPGYDGVPIKKYFGALSEVMKDPTYPLRSDSMDHESPDPDFPAISKQGQRSKWVISQKRTLEDNIRHRGHSGDNDDCPECLKGTVYATLEAATSHLRQGHLVGSMTDERLRHYVVQLSDALVEKRESEQARMLEFGAGTMARILRKLVAIQDGVVHDDELREKRGLPHELLEAFAIIVAFVCALSAAMHKISWVYTDDIPRNSKGIEDLVSHEVLKQLDMLMKLATEAENLIRKAERALMSSTIALLNGQDGPESFQVSVGPHYIAAQIVSNLLKVPVHNQKHVADLYEANLKTLKSRLLRHPSKRYILSITAIADELNMIGDFLAWQAEALSSFDTVLNPETYNRRATPPDRGTLYRMEHRLLQRTAGARIAKDERRVRQMVEGCSRMVADVRELTAIMADDKGQVIFIFTAVTVVFLPLSFVASYVSMSGGAAGAGLDWPGVQGLFWKVAGPLTAGVFIFCLSVAQAGTIRRALRLPRWRAAGVGGAPWREMTAWRTRATAPVSLGWTRRENEKAAYGVEDV